MPLTLLIGLLALLLASSASPHWPQFRGAGASGIADGANLPEAWSGADGKGVLWKARIPGLAHSSPVVWGDQVFVTTAISSRADASFKPGLYGEGTASEDRTVHRWNVLSLDKRTGKVLWERTAYEGEPREKRHIKATYANATPATDGRYVVAFFGSQGLYAYDLRGELKWKRDLGRLDAGAYDAPTYEWGTASSPILYKDLVIVQCDQQKDSFLMALRLRDGETVWKTPREELPSWATPTVYPGDGPGRAELVTNAPNFIRGYDPETGKELWRLGRSSPITAPTPVYDADVIVVMSGRRPNAPIFVLKAGARGDITLPEGAAAGGHVLWTRERAGSYMPTPLIYRGYLYVLKNQGILSCYDLRSGEQKYEQRIPDVNSGFSASPVAADGKLYLASEDGEIVVVKTGPRFELAGRNAMGQPLMATPAISEGTLLVRGERDLFAIGTAPGAAAAKTGGEKDTLRFTKKQLFVNPYESGTVGDLNRDGHLDIVYGAYWFAGPDFVPRTFRPNHASKEYLRANSDHVYDVDADGWPDVIAGGWDEDGIYWYKNPGHRAAERGTPWEMHRPWEARLLARTRGHMEMFALHDYDGDGVPELHSACYRKKEPLEVWRFTKSADGAPALTPFVLGAEGGGHGFAFGDVNGDGREDVLTEIGWYERPAGDPFPRPWKLHAETALPHPSCPFVVKDLNKDGRLDIIFGRGHDVGLYWWEQQPPKPDGATVWKPHVIDESWSQAHALALADLDGDGEEELVAGKCIWAHEGGDPGAGDPPAIYYYRWNKRTSTFTRHTIAAPGDGIALGRQYSVVDLNGDGRLDLTAPSELGLWVFFNEGYR